MQEMLRRFIHEEEGQDLIEYALLAALIAVMTVGALNALQGAIAGQFQDVESALGGS